MRAARRESHPVQHLGRLRLRIRARGAADEERHGDVFDGGEFRQQVMELIHEAERAIPNLPPPRLAEACEWLAADGDLAGGGRIQSAEEMEQRALARSGSAHDRDPLARGHVEVDAEQHWNR